MDKRALITGITGQDGRWLTQLLIDKGYEVWGLVRRISNARNIEGAEMIKNATMVYGDIRDYTSVSEAISTVVPDEVYHLAAQSDVAYSFKYPDETYHTNIDGTLNVLNAIKSYSIDIKMYFAATSEMFGAPTVIPQDEDTKMMPVSPYAVSKLAGYYSCQVYREAYHMPIACGISFNHESEIRSPRFVTRKITTGIKRFLETHKPFELGNLDARKDWGFARDYVEGMWKMLDADCWDNVVFATGKQHTVREFLEFALTLVSISYERRGDGYFDHQGRRIVGTNVDNYRPTEADNYMGNYSKANKLLGWRPKTSFEDMITRMILSDATSDLPSE